MKSRLGEKMLQQTITNDIRLICAVCRPEDSPNLGVVISQNNTEVLTSVWYMVPL